LVVVVLEEVPVELEVEEVLEVLERAIQELLLH
jgi:hypothetical protein